MVGGRLLPLLMSHVVALVCGHIRHTGADCVMMTGRAAPMV